MDGQMHTLDGYEATKRIRQSSDPKIAGMTIIALTASAIQGDRERCIEAGMSDYLSKVRHALPLFDQARLPGEDRADVRFTFPSSSPFEPKSLKR